MAETRPHSPLARWIEDLLGSRAFPVALLAAAAVAAALSLGGLLA